MAWLTALLAAIGKALADYFAQRAAKAEADATTGTAAVEAAAGETAAVVEATADARSRLREPGSVADLAAELRRRAGGGRDEPSS